MVSPPDPTVYRGWRRAIAWVEKFERGFAPERVLREWDSRDPDASWGYRIVVWHARRIRIPRRPFLLLAGGP